MDTDTDTDSQHEIIFDGLDNDIDSYMDSNPCCINQIYLGILITGKINDENMDNVCLTIIPNKVFYHKLIQQYIQSHPIPNKYKVELALVQFNESNTVMNRICINKTNIIKRIQKKYKKAFCNRKEQINQKEIHQLLHNRQLGRSIRSTIRLSLLKGLLV